MQKPPGISAMAAEPRDGRTGAFKELRHVPIDLENAQASFASG